jgi:DNA-binding MarR family transcriptional regulator
MTAPLHQPIEPTAGNRHGDAVMYEADAALDRVLRLLERGQHSATQMRVLLRLLEHRDAGIVELAEQLGSRPTEITRAGRRLAVRGLVRMHHAGQPEQTLMEITPAGRATTQTLLTAAESTAARPSTPERAVR